MSDADSIAAGDGGAFGAWLEDEVGLPCFELRLGASAGDVWHQVGNDRVTATAHADGRTTLYWFEEGLLRLGVAQPPAQVHAVRFGCGWAEWRWRDREFEGVRRVWAPFGDAPGFRVDVELAGTLPPTYTETWCFAPRPIVGVSLMSRGEPPPRGLTRRERLSWRVMLAAAGASRILVERLRDALAWPLRLVARAAPEFGGALLAPQGGPHSSPRPSWRARIPAHVFVASLDGAPQIRSERRGRETRVALEVPLATGSPRARLGFAMGVAHEREIPEQLRALRAETPAATATAWREQFRLELEGAPALAREMTWHAMHLRSAQVRDSVLGARYVPQGSAYTFVHGLQGAPRDYCLSAAALAFFDPEAARETLRLCLRLVAGDGSIAYAHTGAGRTTAAGVHRAPSDLPLFLLWAASELVFVTGDAAFAAEARPALLRTWRWLRDAVGLGPHDLLRVGSGDWNDPITAFAPSRRAFHRSGESSFNAAMAAYVLPRAAAILPEEADGMCALATRLRAALADTWTGSWFLRGFDGRGGAIGHDRLFLDANAWCLIARIGSEAQREVLMRAIAERCAAPSPIGPTILDRPAHVRGGLLPPGWDTNGGVWAAISALTAWGQAVHDPARAWRCLLDQTFAAHARAYPHVWYGIWSGPDCWNSHHGDRPGETFVQPATPMREFPVMNSNAHSGPLLALLRVLGIEATPEGVVVAPRALAAAGAWRLATPVGVWSADVRQAVC
jgi:Glycosyl hydrolase 36 superfamily, catalytic domain